MWKNIPKEEHWLIFDVEIFDIQPWSPKLQFQYMDANNDTVLTSTEVRMFSLNFLSLCRHGTNKNTYYIAYINTYIIHITTDIIIHYIQYIIINPYILYILH